MHMPEVPDLAILGHWYQHFEDRLLRFVRSRIDPVLLARVSPQDILQDAYIKAQREWIKSKKTKSIDCYVWWYGMVRNCLLDTYREHAAKKRDVHCNVALPANSSVLFVQTMQSESPPTPSRDAVEKDRQIERMDLLSRAIDQLDEQEQDILWMRHRDALQYGEIAEVEGVTKEAARKRYVRSLAKLKSIYRKLAGPDTTLPPL